MANYVTFKGKQVSLADEAAFPEVGSTPKEFKLTKSDLTEIDSMELRGKKLLLNIFPSIDTAVCATSVRKLNEAASNLKDTLVICISRDLPFAQKRFCAAENISNVITASDYRDSDFGKDFGVMMREGALSHLFARAVVVLDENYKVLHSELVSEIGLEPNYEKALAVLS